MIEDLRDAAGFREPATDCAIRAKVCTAGGRLRSLPGVPVTEPSDFRELYDSLQRRRFNGTWLESVLVEREMRSGFVVVA